MLLKTRRGVNCLIKYGRATGDGFHFGSKSRDHYLLVLYAVVAIIFFYVVSLNQRNYQDVWILDGIAVPTVMFVCFSLIIKMLAHENRKVVIFAAFFLFSMSLIPGLKYQFFCGCYDPPRHFRFTDAMVSLGGVPETESYSETYGGNPGMHVLMSCVSIVSGISVNDVFKFVIPVLLGIVPFIIYFMTKDLLPDTIQKYTIIVSGFPIITAYVVSGTNLSMILYLLFIAIFLRVILIKRREFWLLFTITGFGLIISHAVTALFAAFLLMGTVLVLKSLEMTRMKSFLSRFPTYISIVAPLSYVVLLVTWWTNVSVYNLEIISGYVRMLFIGGNTIAPVPIRFHQVPLLAQLQVLTVFHLGDFVMGVLSLFGLFILLRKSRRKKFPKETQAIYLLLTVLLSLVVLFLSFQFASLFGELSYSRFINYAIPLCVPLAGLTLGQLYGFLERIASNVARNVAFALVLLALFCACLIQFFPCKPLIPKANVLSSDLPKNEFIVDLGAVNTPYQIEMISFAERYSSEGKVAADIVTRCQTYGFSNHSLFSRVMWPSPLSQNLEWDLLMIHTSKAGPFHEKVEYRTSERIENFRLEGNTIYDNSGSFIISSISTRFGR